jgi:hypothetical protein
MENVLSKGRGTVRDKGHTRTSKAVAPAIRAKAKGRVKARGRVIAKVKVRAKGRGIAKVKVKAKTKVKDRDPTETGRRETVGRKIAQDRVTVPAIKAKDKVRVKVRAMVKAKAKVKGRLIKAREATVPQVKATGLLVSVLVIRQADPAAVGQEKAGLVKRGALRHRDEISRPVVVWIKKLQPCSALK